MGAEMQKAYDALKDRMNDIDAMSEHNAYSGGDLSLSGTTMAVLHDELLAAAQHIEGDPAAESLNDWLDLFENHYKVPNRSRVYQAMSEAEVCELSEQIRPWVAALWTRLHAHSA